MNDKGRVREDLAVEVDADRIDISLMPAVEVNQMCSVLSSCISRALADPRLRREYEDWKKERRCHRDAGEGNPSEMP